MGPIPKPTPKHHIECVACGEAVHAENIRYHRTTRRHVDAAKRSGLWCALCAKTFVSAPGAREHHEALHAPPPPVSAPPRSRRAAGADRQRCDVCFEMLDGGGDRTEHDASTVHTDACKALGLWCATCRCATAPTAEHSCLDRPLPAPSSTRICGDCGEEFPTRNRRKKHKTRGECRVANQPRECFCSICAVFVTAEDVRAHRGAEGHAAAARERGLWCSLCDVSFVNEAGLADHRLRNARHLDLENAVRRGPASEGATGPPGC